MAKLERLIAAHPIPGEPYDKLEFVKLNQHRVPLYSVKDCEEPPSGGFEALRRAFVKYGGKCFYCGTRFEAQQLTQGIVHRDHVLAKSRGGSDMLHNLVIACSKCDRIKAADPIHDFRPKSAKAYLAALENHIARCVREAG
jgi:5-methylcytosine-specific restriction endonuclease McrA